MFNYIENHSSRTRSNEPCTPRCTVLRAAYAEFLPEYFVIEINEL